MINEEFENLKIELVDPIGKKKLEKSKNLDKEIVNVLNENGMLTTKQVFMKLRDVSNTERSLFDHLNNLADQGILKKGLVQSGSVFQARWKIKDLSDKILELLEEEGGINTIQLLSRLYTNKLNKGLLERHLNKLLEDDLIKIENGCWELVIPKNIDDLIIELLKRRGKLNTVQIISDLKQFSPNTIRPHLNQLTKLEVIKKYQRREGKVTINYWEYSNK